MQQNAATAEELAASSEELNSQADYMKDLMNYFKVDEKGAAKLAKKKVAIPTYSEEISKNKAVSISDKSNGVHLNMDMEGGSDSIDKGFEKF